MQSLMPPIDSSDNLFHNGNPLTGEKGTIVTADFLNNTQSAIRDAQTELIAVMTAAGLKPDSATAGQLLTSLKKLFLIRSNAFSDIVADGAAAVTTALTNLGLSDVALAGANGGVLASAGYIMLPMVISGAKKTLYIQWGSFTGTTSSSAGTDSVYENSNISVTWPVAFPNAILQVITGGLSDVGGVGMQEMAWNLSKTKSTGIFGVQCRAANASMTGSYLAIGY